MLFGYHNTGKETIVSVVLYFLTDLKHEIGESEIFNFPKIFDQIAHVNLNVLL